jgi:hypothetical protein
MPSANGDLPKRHSSRVYVYNRLLRGAHAGPFKSGRTGGGQGLIPRLFSVATRNTNKPTNSIKNISNGPWRIFDFAKRSIFFLFLDFF